MQYRELARKLLQSYIPIACRRATIQVGLYAQNSANSFEFGKQTHFDFRNVVPFFFLVFLEKIFLKTLIFKMGLNPGRVTLKL